MLHNQFLTLLLAVNFCLLFFGYAFKKRIFAFTGIIGLFLAGILVLGNGGISYACNTNVVGVTQNVSATEINSTLQYATSCSNDTSLVSTGLGLGLILMAIVALIDIVDVKLGKSKPEDADLDGDRENE